MSKDNNETSSIENMFNKILETWHEIDFVVHALAYSDKEELKGKYVNCSRENFLNSLDISAFSFTRTAKSAFPLMSSFFFLLYSIYFSLPLASLFNGITSRGLKLNFLLKFITSSSFN